MIDPVRASTAALLLTLVAAPAAAATDPGPACQRAVGKAGAFVVRIVLKAEQACLEKRSKGKLPPATICVGAGPSLAAITDLKTVTSVQSGIDKARASILKKCAGVDVLAAPPVGVGAASACPQFAGHCDLTVSDATSFATCLECTHVTASQALVAAQDAGATQPLPTPTPLPQTVRHVDPVNGADTPSCGTSGNPCRHIQQAVNLSDPGDEIRVAAGTYTYSPALDTVCSAGFDGATAVVCVPNKHLTLRGGFSAGAWTTADPVAHPTIIDGGQSRRGVYVVHTLQTPPVANTVLEGFTITRGRVVGAASGGDDVTFAFGAGMLVDFAPVTLRDVTFSDNEVVGGGASVNHGGAGVGAAIAFRAVPGTSELDDVTFTGNVARGGTGTTRGGYAIGGGIFTYQTVLNGQHLVFDDNAAIGGTTSGNGILSGERGDAQGAGLAVHLDSVVTLVDVVATDNHAIGGDAATDAGGGFGGALYAELGTLAVADADLRGNSASGGDATNGGIGAGGGIMTQDATLVVERSRIVDNRSTAGDGTAAQGAAGGGGAYLSRLGNRDTSITMVNSIVAANTSDLGSGPTPLGGGGAGIFLQGVEATLEHLTVAGNTLASTAMQGAGIVVLPGSDDADVTLSHSILAEHVSGSGAAALHVQPGNAITLTRGIFAGNTKDTNANGVPGPAGTFSGLASMLSESSVEFVAAGAPDFDYHVDVDSPAVNQALTSTQLLDVDGATRVDIPDIGADEAGV